MQHEVYRVEPSTTCHLLYHGEEQTRRQNRTRGRQENSDSMFTNMWRREKHPQVRELVAKAHNLSNLGRYEEALALYERARQLTSDPGILKLIALTLSMMKRPTEALAACDTAWMPLNKHNLHCLIRRYTGAGTPLCQPLPDLLDICLLPITLRTPATEIMPASSGSLVAPHPSPRRSPSTPLPTPHLAAPDPRRASRSAPQTPAGGSPQAVS